MHPTVMTMIAGDRAVELRGDAAMRRRSRLARGGSPRRFALRLPRRAKLAHA